MINSWGLPEKRNYETLPLFLYADSITDLPNALNQCDLNDSLTHKMQRVKFYSTVNTTV